MNTPLNTFPFPLLRLILCGGGGLAPAWGPLKDALGMTWPWDPNDEDIAWPPGCPSGTRDIWCQPPLAAPQQWSLPLDAESPWPARLALVAAWIVSNQTPFTAWLVPAADEGERGDADPELRWVIRIRVMQCSWSAEDGRCWISNAPHWPNLPTLPQHIQTHPPAIALVLALWDVPEIRVRIEAP